MMTLKEFKRIKKVAGLSFCLQAHCSFRAKSDLCMNDTVLLSRHYVLELQRIHLHTINQ